MFIDILIFKAIILYILIYYIATARIMNRALLKIFNFMRTMSDLEKYFK